MNDQQVLTKAKQTFVEIQASEQLFPVLPEGYTSALSTLIEEFDPTFALRSSKVLEKLEHLGQPYELKEVYPETADCNPEYTPQQFQTVEPEWRREAYQQSFEDLIQLAPDPQQVYAYLGKRFANRRHV